jgi:crossover junction endodeoxyribonuclease RuvC
VIRVRICGIDPGLNTSGYAVLDADGHAMTVCDAGICRTQTDAELKHRLVQIEADFAGLFEQWRPAVVAVEQLYAHYRHPRTAVLMGHARGVMLVTAGRFGAEVRSYGATEVKRFLTGNGQAGKGQVQRAITAALGLPALPEPADVADALAIALAAAYDLSRRPCPERPV